MPKRTLLHLMMVGLMTSATGLKAQTLIAHFPLDADGNSLSVGGFTASTVTDVEFGGEGANANTGTSAYFNGTSSLIQHDWIADLNPEESFTLALWARSDGGAGAWHSPVTSRNDLNPDSQGYIIYDNEPAGKWTFWSGNGTEDGNWLNDGIQLVGLPQPGRVGGGSLHLWQPTLIGPRARSFQCSLQPLWQSDEGNRNRSHQGKHGGRGE